MQEPVAGGALGELVAIRVALDGFRDAPKRTVIIDEMGPRISSQIPRHLSVRQQVQAIVQTCLRVPGGLATLANVLMAFHGDDRTVERFRQLVEALSLPRSCGSTSGETLAASCAARCSARFGSLPRPFFVPFRRRLAMCCPIGTGTPSTGSVHTAS